MSTRNRWLAQRWTASLLVGLLLLPPAGAWAANHSDAPLSKQDPQTNLTDVYAFIGKRNDANALVVVTTQGVVLVDAGNNPPETRLLQNFIKSVTNQPVRYVVITQNHGDHTGGTPLFAPPAHVIVHERVARDWTALKPYQIKSWRKRFRERAEALKDVSPIDVQVDGIAELWFKNQADFDAYQASPATKRLRDDGATFIGREIDFVADEKVIIS